MKNTNKKVVKMNFFAKQKLYKQILNNRPVDLCIHNNWSCGMFTRTWIYNGGKVVACYNRIGEYSAYIHFPGEHIEFAGIRAKNIYQHAEKSR